ncbi:MAG: DUF1573 domain-containing protein [Chitinophagales bacterium]|nr:DUF1573 domain-containing protein [Chitinophagales bacterium]MDW8428561.1 DUF1573 domain-containing protein [Chitinophagales bacterium]
MKNFVVVVVGLMFTAFSVTAQNQPAATQPTQTITPSNSGATNPNAGEFKFETETYDFGKIPRGIPVTHDFVFTNVGKEPIIISNVQASCGCTTPSWPKEPILPGKTGVIKVQYNAASPGSFNKSITIMSNAKTPTKVLYVKGMVEAQVEQTTPERTPSMLSSPNN